MVIKMENIKIDVEDYIQYGLGDIYYGLISFISNYVTQNYNPMETFQSDNSQYAFAVTIMKKSLKELLDYLKQTNEIYLPSLRRNINLKTLNIEEQLALEERCKEYLILKLNESLNKNLESHETQKSK